MTPSPSTAPSCRCGGHGTPHAAVSLAGERSDHSVAAQSARMGRPAMLTCSIHPSERP